MATARVFTSTEEQIVLLPEEFHFDAEELVVFRRGDEVVLREPKRSAIGIFHALTSMPDDFFADGSDDPPPQEREWL